MAKFAIGLEDIKLKIDTINGVAPIGTNPFSGSSATISVGEVAEGSTSLNHAEATETSIKGDYSDAPLYIMTEAGEFTVETDVIEVDGDKFAMLTGGSYASATGIITLPASSPNIVGSIALKFKNGFDTIHVKKASLVANYVGANLKTEMFKLHLKATALKDVAGNVAELKLKQ